jgi:hypothetical protein
MKKIIILAISILVLGAFTVKATNPIPSYNVHVFGQASFQETGSGLSTSSPGDEKRDLNIQNSGGNYCPGASVVTVLVYRLDMKKSQGPFVIADGETLSVPIDNQEWGVQMDSSRPVTVSVWANE